jgi:hypothetical protein
MFCLYDFRWLLLALPVSILLKENETIILLLFSFECFTRSIIPRFFGVSKSFASKLAAEKTSGIDGCTILLNPFWTPEIEEDSMPLDIDSRGCGP